MNRRRFLAMAGTATLAAGAGCIDAIGGDGTSTEYPTESFQGETVPLAPLADVHEWWEDGDAKFVDTRGESQYDAGHIEGAVLSPAAGGRADDPTDDWPSDARIVTYCDCPHTLAVRRGAELLADGFEAVYALDDGFGAWQEAGYPVESNDPDAEVSTYEIVGDAGSGHAGEYVYVRTTEGEVVEAAGIDEDGRFEATIRVPDLTEESTLIVETPGYTREGTVAELTEGTVTAE